MLPRSRSRQQFQDVSIAKLRGAYAYLGGASMDLYQIGKMWSPTRLHPRSGYRSDLNP
jgi:hypothetical protein